MLDPDLTMYGPCGADRMVGAPIWEKEQQGRKRCAVNARPSCSATKSPQTMPTASSSASQPAERLNNISNHIMGSAGPNTVFSADVVPQAPEDPLFGLMAAYRKDTSDKKVDLGIGAYRDNHAKPWVLPVVKKVCKARLG